jgi:tRNA pseudouridine32 synthase / 23S rRNA pseudouridine746 synthase
MTEMLSIGSSVRGLDEGWYGFCFGSQKRRSSCECSLSLVFNETRVTHRLPLQVNGEVIFSVDYGRLVFIKTDSVVSVVADENATPCPYHTTRDPSSDLQWRLVLRHASSVPDLGGGEWSDRTKSIVCATCARTFATVSSAQAHSKDNHKQVSAAWARPLTVVYNDDDFAVVDKPQGISVQGKTLQRSDLLLPLAGPDGRKPIIVHRLDAATGGLLVVAKTKESERYLRMAFAQQRCKKRYRAVVFGRVEADSGIIEEPVSGKSAETRYQVISRTRCNDPRANGWISTVDLFPVSGRKHQIRRHLKHIGHPIWGDRRYSWYTKELTCDEECELSEDDKLNQLLVTTVEKDAHARLCLWAMEINVPHPRTNEFVSISLSKEPDWIAQLVKYQEKIFFQSL